MAFVGGLIQLPTTISKYSRHNFSNAAIRLASYKSEREPNAPNVWVCLLRSGLGLISGLVGVAADFLTPILLLMNWTETKKSPEFRVLFRQFAAGLLGNWFQGKDSQILNLLQPSDLDCCRNLGGYRSTLGSKYFNSLMLRRFSGRLTIAGFKLYLRNAKKA